MKKSGGKVAEELGGTWRRFFVSPSRVCFWGIVILNVVKNLEYIHALCIRDPSSLRSSGWHCTLWFFLVLKTHVTHCTSSVNRWISMCPSAMCLFFTCHWCHLAGSSDISDKRFFLSLHGDVLIISGLYTSCNEWHEFYHLDFISRCSVLNDKGWRRIGILFFMRKNRRYVKNYKHRMPFICDVLAFFVRSRYICES